jgi:hypothetical protein
MQYLTNGNHKTSIFRLRIMLVSFLRLYAAGLMIVGPGVLCGEQRPVSADVVQQYSEAQAMTVLNLAFATERVRNTALSLVLRFQPSSQPPSQLAIRYLRDSSVLVESLVASQTPVWALLQQHATTSQPDLQTAVTLMAVKRRTTELSIKDARKWLDAFWRAYADSASPLEKTQLDYVVQMDGTLYTIEYVDTRYRISFVLPGPELRYENSSDLPLIEWAVAVRKDIEALLNRSPEEAGRQSGR